MLRIVQIGPYPISSKMISGGVEASVYGLANEQSKSNTVFVIDIPRKEYNDSVENIGNLTVFRYKNKGEHNKDAVGRIPEIVEMILKLTPSVCHIHGTGIFSCKMFEALKKKGIPSVVTVHGLLMVEKKKALSRHFSLKALYQYIMQTKYEQKLLKTAPEIIVDTNYVVDTIKRYTNPDLSKIHIIPQGIDERYFRLSCSADSHTIISVGAFSRRKGQMLLIKAFEKLCENDIEARLVICGNIAEKDYYSEVENCVSHSSFKDRISLQANVMKDDLFQHFSKAKVFALHSQEESQGIVLAEAMAVGLPVVSTRVGGIPDVICDGKTGFLTEYGDIDAFADAMKKLQFSDVLWSQMSTQCNEEAKRYSWIFIAENIEKVYRSIVHEHKL